MCSFVFGLSMHAWCMYVCSCMDACIACLATEDTRTTGFRSSSYGRSVGPTSFLWYVIMYVCIHNCEGRGLCVDGCDSNRNGRNISAVSTCHKHFLGRTGSELTVSASKQLRPRM